jgi:hypothetical protein
MDVGEALLPYRNATNIFLKISNTFSYFKILINKAVFETPCITSGSHIEH